MKRVFLAATALLAIWMSTQLAKADTTGDPLHLFCGVCTGDNGTNNPFPVAVTPTDITVTESGTSGGLTGNFILKILIPVDSTVGTPSITSEGVTGTVGGVPLAAGTQATLAQGPGGLNFFTTGFGPMPNNPALETEFLGFNAANGSPPNRLNTFLGPTQGASGGDPNAVGYIVLTLGGGVFDGLTVPENGQPGVSPFDLSLTGPLPGGSWILGDVLSADCPTGVTGLCDTTTATSAALFASTTAVPGPIAGAGIPGLVAASLSILALARRRFNRWRDWRIASA